MGALAALLMRRRSNAITAAAVCGALSLLMPPLTYVSGAIVGLATLKQGPREGGLVVAGAALLCAAFSMLIVGSPIPAVGFLLMSWAPMWVIASVLSASRSQGAALVAATALGVVAVTCLHVLLADPTAWWRAAMGEVFEPVARANAGNAAAMTGLQALLDAWAPRMTRFFGAAIVIGLMATLSLARWWHASLDNPGGFGREFRALRVPRMLLAVTIVLGVASLFIPAMSGAWIGDLLGPLTAMAGWQGLAIVHALVKRRAASVGWLVAVYGLLVIPPHVAMPVLILLGLLDGWIDIRARAGAGGSEREDLE